ncbi:ATP-binding protein [Pseudomonas laurylsulfatiphila]|uniref:ATP-binding protein n=1 Tax=Pseudomonas laurylsulfatiphila TaxID=2011015 RepID=UPI00215FE58C|nr:transporter substrate-binding domain-containing protein [Pseudomonas laurylsulfatiphila]UVM05739.1 transporter substrate-binding domain-containing protein [Pseudomonas laurylsulfatiphila]
MLIDNTLFHTAGFQRKRQSWLARLRPYLLLLVASGALLSLQAVALESVRLEGDSGLPRVTVPIDPDERQWLDARRVIRLGTTTMGYQPLELIRGKAVKGITADYLTIVGHSLGLKVEVRIYPDWTTALGALSAGEVDVLGRGSSYEALLPGLQLSRPYTENQPVLVGRTGDMEEGEFLSNGRLAVVDGYASLDELRARFPALQMDIYSTVREALHAVEYQSDRWLICDAVTVAYHLSLGELPSLRMRPLSGQKTDGYSFVFRANDSALRDMFDRVLDAIPRLAQSEILGHWGVNARFDSVPVSFYSAEQLEWLASRPEVKVVVSGGAPPYSFYDDEEEFHGLIADLLSEVSQQTGLRFKVIERTTMSEMLKALRDGDAQMTTMVLPSPENKDLLEFTDPFATSSYALVGRRDSNIKKIADLEGQKVALLRSASVATVDFIQEHYPKIALVSTDSPLETLTAVAKGEVQAGLMLIPISRYMINQYFAKDLRVITSLPQIQADLSFAVVKDNPMLLGVLQVAVNQLEPRLVGNLVERWQNSLPAQSSVWGRYEQRLRGLLVAGGGVLGLLVIWQGYAYFNRLRNRAEEARQAFRSALLDGIPQSVVVRDLQGRFVLCNHTFYSVFGLRPETVIGRTWSEIDGLDQLQSETQELAYQALLQKNEVIDVRQIELNIRNQPLTFRQWAVPHRASDGQTVGVLMGWVDVSATEKLMRQLHELRDQAVQASEAKSRFLAVMSHEIRTPLNAIIGLLELTMERVDRGEPWDRTSIEVAYSSSGALMLLIGDILDLAKIEAGKLTLEAQRSTPSEILESVQRVFSGVARQKGLYLESHLQLDSAKDVLIDGARLKQVLSNLLSNAIKFTDRGGVKLSLRVHEIGGDLNMRFDVEDSGIGIAAADQKRLFEPFSQVPGQSHQRGGTGLGLAICQQIVEMMGGKLQLDSEVGSGTRITVEIVAPSLEPEHLNLVPQLPKAPKSQMLRVLLVDDHLPNRLLLRQQLCFLGHSVWESEDGRQAIKCLQDKSFDVVITDCNMPVMDGYELTRWIRIQESENLHKPCLIVGFTANAQAEERLRCLEVGMDDCLFKPVSLNMLRICLGRLEECHETVHRQTNQVISIVDANDSAQHFDLALLESLTGGEHSMIRILLRELHTTNDADMQRLDKLLLECRWRDLGQIIHRLKGAARMVGAMQLINAAKSYEEGIATAMGDDDVQRLARNVRDAVSQLQVAITEWIALPGR